MVFRWADGVNSLCFNAALALMESGHNKHHSDMNGKPKQSVNFCLLIKERNSQVAGLSGTLYRNLSA